ncbi:MAG: hypothetical protein JXK05_07390 [Campylobacterales bacterium]|nr:hypothetical protein [Campylobacterales bacterium]
MKPLHALTLGALAFSTFMVSGCATKVVSHNPYKQEVCYVESDQRKYTLNEGRVHYQKLTDEAIDVVFNSLAFLPKQVIVTEFVDLTSLENHSKFGYVLSNSIKNSIIAQINAEVVEAEVSKYFKLSANGLKVLTRDTEAIRSDNLNIKHAVAGTYTYTDKEAVVFVKLVNLENGIIEGSYSRTLPMNCAMLQLLKEQ